MEDAAVHLNNGVQKVIISAPSPSESVRTVLVGINDGEMVRSGERTDRSN